MKLGILGGGQLGMMMCQEAKDLEISTFIFTIRRLSVSSPNCCHSVDTFVKKHNTFCALGPTPGFGDKILRILAFRFKT